MKKESHSSAPEGYSTVCPYLLVGSVEQELDFLRHVFHAEIIEEHHQADKTVMHGEARIGNSVIMMGKSREGYRVIESMNYVFVTDVDATYKKGLTHGATSLMEPEDKFYGHREAGFKDPQGIQWYVATQIEKLSQEEMEKRMAQQKK